MTTAERVQALVGGPPAWARRLKHIEDLRKKIAAMHEAGAARHELLRQLDELVALVEAHNAYYPIEANLPFDPTTSRLIDHGKPWRPMPRPTLDDLTT